MFPMVNFHLRKHRISRIIEAEARRKKQVIYGSQAMNRHLSPALRRRTSDYDIYTRTPRATANRMQRRLDREVAGQDDFYARRAKHYGTYRVLHEGPDQRKRTKDDVHIVDYTKTPKTLRFVKTGPLRYESLASIERGKRKSLMKPQNKYRHRKDRSDLARIECHKALRDMLKPKWWQK